MSHQGKRDRAKRMTNIAETAMAKLIEVRECLGMNNPPADTAQLAWDYALAMEDRRAETIRAIESVEVDE